MIAFFPIHLNFLKLPVKQIQQSTSDEQAVIFAKGKHLVLALLLASCTTPPRAPSFGFADGSGPEVLGVQYAAVTGNDGVKTVEVFLANKGSASVTFTNAVLDGTALLGEKDRASRLAAGTARFNQVIALDSWGDRQSCQ